MTTRKRPVVVGYDGSLPNRAALSWASDEAVRTGAPLRIVECYEVMLAPPAMPGIMTWLATLQAAREEALATVEAEVCSRVPGLEVSCALRNDSAAHGLINESAQARTVVVGTRGSGGWPALSIGSSAMQVSAHAHCPVVVVPHDRGPRTHDGRLVAIGVDGSKDSARAIDFAFDQAAILGAGVIAVHAWHNPFAVHRNTIEPLLFDDEQIQAEAQVLVSESITGAAADHPDVPVEIRLVEGHPARALLAAGESADLIVVGSRGRGGFAGLLLGSVSQAVLRHAPCPIAVIR